MKVKAGKYSVKLSNDEIDIAINQYPETQGEVIYLSAEGPINKEDVQELHKHLGTWLETGFFK